MFVCSNGHLFEEPSHYQESREFWGMPCSESFACCPICKDDEIDEAESCEICGEYFVEDEMWNKVCEICAKESFDRNLALRYVEEHREAFYLDYLWGITVSDEQKDKLINILEKEYLTNFTEANEKELEEFCLDDLYDWVEFIKEGV